MSWRNFGEHRAAQAKGRESIFRDYRIRVVSVIRDYGISDVLNNAAEFVLTLT